jgi:nucleotide sugar dehydrogenase
MSAQILYTKPEEMDTAEKRGRYTVSIIGCGQIGVLHACLLAEAGFKVICVDADQTIVNLLAKGKTPFFEKEAEFKWKQHVRTGRSKVISEIGNAVSQSDIIVITAPAKIGEKKKTDYSNLENICKQVSQSLQRGSLIIVMSAVGFGFTEGMIKEILENNSGFKVGPDFGLAYNPILVSNAQSLELLTNHDRMIAALEKNSLNSASIVLESISKKGIKKVDNVKALELATLFKAVQADVNTALASEFAFFCEKAGVDYLEIYKLLNSNATEAVSLPALVGKSTEKEVSLLLEDAENLNAKLQIPKIAQKINEETIRHAVNLIQSALRDCGKTLRRARIALLGIVQTANVKSPLKNAAKELAKILEARGAKVSLHDPYFSENEPTDMPYSFKKNLTEVVEGSDCLVILTKHDKFRRLDLKKIKVMMKMPSAIVDFEGIVEPDKAEKEGFIYRGLGRGVERK